ncbi:MAG: DUF4276 family protein [Rhodobacteraceae bacterium]|nr:DUF4276 family protein [Paracoccaceae bacterium]MCY4196493.1 DUF4276 family protein [Paracoccaceae bacterium]MCY4327790.1 DUF4276 family protein [Paracoccaceae bacterium]
MIRLAISVEGRTEEEFVNSLLTPHLQLYGIAAQPILLGRARNRGGCGGDVTVQKLVRDMTYLKHAFDAVTTFVDFYGFRGKEQNSATALEDMIRADVGEKIDGRRDKIIPYIQMHEFEGLLFSDAKVFNMLPDIPQAAIGALEKVRSAFVTPEDINDSKLTAPSRRIENEIPHYQKVAHGPMIATKTGLERIRAECPRFNAWLKCLETLQTAF